MTEQLLAEQEVFDRLAPLVVEVTGVDADEISMDSRLVDDLGAESIDLLDLSFLIEERFGITIEPNEFERQVRERVPGGEYEREGRLTQPALTELQKLLPEVDRDRFEPGLRKMDLPALLTVSVFVHLIQRKLAQGDHDAEG